MVIHTNICTNENYSLYDTIKLYLYGLDHRYHIVSLLSKVNDSKDTFCTQDLTFIYMPIVSWTQTQKEGCNICGLQD